VLGVKYMINEAKREVNKKSVRKSPSLLKAMGFFTTKDTKVDW